MIYARQIEPEIQESPLMDYDEWPEDIAAKGNGDYKDHCPEVFTRVLDALENGELYEALEDLRTHNGGYYTEWYKNPTEAINDLLKPEKPCYSTRDIHKIKILVTEYAEYSGIQDRVLCEVLSIVTGHTWDHKTIRGCCQSDWQDIYYVVDSWSNDALDAFEVEYFNSGSEWIIHDRDNIPKNPEEVNGYRIYCHELLEKDIAAEIAAVTGVNPEEVVLWAFDGYTNKPVFTRIA